MMQTDTAVAKELSVKRTSPNSCSVTCLYIDARGRESPIWYEIAGSQDYTPLTPGDAFLSPVLARALKEGSNVRFEIPISETLAQNSREIAFLYGSVLARAKYPQISFSKLETTGQAFSGVAIAFSAGVDSWFSFKKLFLDCTQEGQRLTHLVAFDVGANATAEKIDQVFSRVALVAQEYEIDFVTIRSNLNEFIKLPFQQTHTLRNASAALLLAPICGKFFYSSSTTLERTKVQPTHDMCYIDPLVLPLLSNGAIVLRPFGSTYKRSEKTKEILSIPKIEERLDVCTAHSLPSNKLNCGRCWKCMRTELTLEAFGVLTRFERTFDLDAYRRRRKRFLEKAAASRSPSEQDAFDVARQAQIIGPKWAYKIEWSIVRIYQKVRHLLARLFQ